MNNYKQYFTEAIERTKRFGLRLPDISMTNNRYINSNSVSAFAGLAQDIFGNCQPEEVALQCLQINWNVLEEVSEFFECKAYYSIGHIQDPKRSYFKNSEEDLFKHIDNDVSQGSFNLHAWITLDSYEIIDLTFATSWGVVNKNKEAIGGITLTHPDNLKKERMYVPMLVGVDYLFSVGAVAVVLPDQSSGLIRRQIYNVTQK